MRKRPSNKKRTTANSAFNLENTLVAKTENQKNYIRSIVENDIIFCIGPAGSGKSYVAAGIACEYLHRKEISKIIVTRPLICTGKDIGSLPGELSEKILPYLSPMKNNIEHFLGHRYYGYYFNEKKILFEPLELMRGSTFDDAIMILDEAQNCTLEQIKMFVTRIGQKSKVIINGDIDQTDLKNKSGLDVCINKLMDVEGIAICELTVQDIQRHDIIGKFLQALEK